MRCACGQRRSKWAQQCRACAKKSAVDAAKSYAEASARGTCPRHPDRHLVFNNALASSMWLQCPGVTSRSLGGLGDCGYQVLCGRDEYRAVVGGAR